MQIKNINLIDANDWNDVVQKTYKKPYCFQQQNGCQDRGLVSITVPEESDYKYSKEIPEDLDGDKMGVDFSIWLNRDPKLPFKTQKYDYELDLWWHRNFYPDHQEVANDLHKKGLLPTGVYNIRID
jgi:hypothetical protein